MANRTLNFYGFAYGNVPVQLNAHINGQVVFSGEVPTTDTPIPEQTTIVANTAVLFSVADSSLFPTDFEGAYPMTVSIATGYGIALGDITCNYMPTGNVVSVDQVEMLNASINGTTLTVGSVSQGTIKVGQMINTDANTVLFGTTIMSGSDLTWTVNNSQTLAETTIYGDIQEVESSGASGFLPVFNSNPTNSEGTPDPRSSVQIDGVTQVPPIPPSQGTWVWVVPQGSTISCNLNASIGSA